MPFPAHWKATKATLAAPAAALGAALRRAGLAGLVLLAALVLDPLPSFALDPNQPIGQLYHSSWTAKDGLTGTVWGLAQTVDGFLWVGTSDGLFRFDGVSFEHYKPEIGSLPASFVTTLLAVPDGGLWIGYYNGGVSFLKHGQVTNYSYTDRAGLPTGTVRNLARDLDGNIWAALVGGLARFDGRSWQHIFMDWNFPAKSPSSIGVDHRGTVWACAWHEGVFSLARGEHRFQQAGLPPIPGTGSTFAEAPDGTVRLWVILSSSILRFGSPQHPANLPPGTVSSGGTFLIDRDGAAWVVTETDGIGRIRFPDWPRTDIISARGADVEKFSRKEGLTNGDVNVVLEDREGNIWVGTSSGLDRFRHRNLSWTAFPPSGASLTLVAGDRSDLWAGSPGMLVNLPDGKTIEGGPRWSDFAYRDSDGAIWLWGGKGDPESGVFWRYQNGHFAKVTLPFPEPVRAMARDGAGDSWVSIRGRGVFRQDHGVWKLVEMLKGQSDMTAYAAVDDPDGRVWFAYPERSAIAVWDHGAIESFSAANGLKIGAVNSLAVRDRQVWAGGELGLAYFKGGQFQTVEATEGGGFTNIAAIISTPTDGLWFSNGVGIVHFPASELALALRDASHKTRSEIFDLVSDLPEPTQSFMLHHTSAARGSDGILWLWQFS
jgi:ligand-binding sensor domain-containing protein